MEATQENFIIDNDSKADWAIEQIASEKEETERLIQLCEFKIQLYQQKVDKYKERYENSTSYLKHQLRQYFETVNRKKTKTQEKYELPTGTLKLKYQQPNYKRDDNKLVEWLEDTGRTELVKIKKSPDWTSLKKTVATVGNSIVSEDGEVIPGVEVEEKEPIFDIELG